MFQGLTPWMACVAMTGAVSAGTPAAIAGHASALASVTAQGRVRTVYVSALDSRGAPVPDMRPSDFEVKEGGRLQEISVKPATAEFRIAVLVADWGTGNFQAGLARFLEKLYGHAEFSLVSVLLQPITVLDYTDNLSALIGGLNRLGVRGRQRDAQLIEAIQEATRTVRHETKRPVILVLRIGAEATTSLSGDRVREDLRKSHALLEVISMGVQTAATPTATGDDPISTAQNQMRDDEQKQSAFALAQVLGDGSRESGGRNDHIISTTLVTALDQLAEELLHQYEITYTLPEGVKPSEKLTVSSRRKGVTVRAPTRFLN
jgi:hypothetical protein